MSGDGEQQRILPLASTTRGSNQNPLLLPSEFNESERNTVFADASTAYTAATIYQEEFQLSEDPQHLEAVILCYKKAAELATTLSTGLIIDIAETLLTSFEPRHGQLPDTGRLDLGALDDSISGSRARGNGDENAGSIGAFALAWMLLVRYVITGQNEDFDQAVAIWTPQARDGESLDAADQQAMAQMNLATAYLQKYTKYERSDEVAQQALEWAQESLESSKALPDSDQIEPSLLLAVAYEQSFAQHGNQDDITRAVEICQGLMDESTGTEAQRARIQYEFGRLTAVLGKASGDRGTIHEGIHNVQRATEDTPKDDPAWECRQEVFQELLEAFAGRRIGLNALIRAKKAEVAASAALHKPEHTQGLTELAELYRQRYELRHTLDDLEASRTCLGEAAEASNATLVDRFQRLGGSAVNSIDLYWDDDDLPNYAEQAFKDGKMAVELADQISKEDMAVLEPTFVGSVYQSAATAYRLKYDGDGDEGEGDLSLLEGCIEVLEKGIAFLGSCEDSNPVRTFREAMRGDLGTHRSELERVKGTSG